MPKVLDFNRHAWFSYSGDHAVSGKWGVHFDGQLRRSDLGLGWQQYQLRPGLNYEVSKRFLLTVGYVHTRTYRYGEFPFRTAFPEHRVYQQALIRRSWEHIRFQHRIRMEQRWIRYPFLPASGWTYQNRFRYLVKAEIPFYPGSRWYVPAYDEVLIGLPPNYGSRPFDQNRLFLGIGRSLRLANVEAGYLNQFTGQRNGRIFEMNHTIMVTVTSSASLSTLLGR